MEHGLVVLFQIAQTLFDFTIVDAQKIIGASSHVDIVGLALGALFVQKAVHRIICRSILKHCGHDLYSLLD